MRSVIIGGLVIVAALLTVPLQAAQVATGGAAAPPAPNIKVAIGEVEAQLNEATVENAKYTGGLVKALIEARIALLSQTLAMLKQRAASQSFNVAMRYTVDGRPFVPPADAGAQRASVEEEIRALKAKILLEQAEADRYSGGLVQAMSLATVATSRQTLAMLEQKRLALAFGLPQYIGFATSTGAAPATPAAPRPAQQPTAPARPPEATFEIVSIDYRVTERNDTFWRHSWKLVLKNTSAEAAVFRAEIEFQDADGFLVDSDTGRDLVVPANSEQSFTGAALVTTSSAAKIAKVNAKVQRTR